MQCWWIWFRKLTRATNLLTALSSKEENLTLNKQMVLLNFNNKISVIYHRWTYVWNSSHNSASGLDRLEADCSLVCAVVVLLGVPWVHSLIFSVLSPPLSLSDCLSSPHWLFQTMVSSCEVVKPSGTSLKRQRGLQMASISLSHANKASYKEGLLARMHSHAGMRAHTQM